MSNISNNSSSIQQNQNNTGLQQQQQQQQQQRIQVNNLPMMAHNSLNGLNTVDGMNTGPNTPRQGSSNAVLKHMSPAHLATANIAANMLSSGTGTTSLQQQHNNINNSEQQQQQQ